MKVKKLARRLRKLSAEFALRAADTRALPYDDEAKEAECARLSTIADVCQVLADEVFTDAGRKPAKKRNKGAPISAANGWTKYKDLPANKAAV